MCTDATLHYWFTVPPRPVLVYLTAHATNINSLYMQIFMFAGVLVIEFSEFNGKRRTWQNCES